MNRTAGTILILASAVLLAACGRKELYLQNYPIEKGSWPAERFYRFDFPVNDTTGIYNIYVQVRNDGRYAYSNLWLFIRTTSPTGAMLRDTIECRLAEPTGRWEGRGSGGRFSLEIPYRYHVRFPNPGRYLIEINQGMRDPVLQYITDLGVRIEKAD